MQITNDIVLVTLDGMVNVNHRIGSAWNFAVMDDSFGLEFLEDAFNKIPFLKITNIGDDRFAREFLPNPDTLMQRNNWSQAICATFHVHPSSQKIINHRDFVTTFRKVHGCTPAKITITTKN